MSRAVRLLDPQPGERIADLFCGLGNFSLPLATRGAQVIGFEGSSDLVERARRNAALNGLAVQFEVMNLVRPNLDPYAPFDKLLIDPPREGAVEIVKALPAAWPRRIAYVSCDPATLARDAGVLVTPRASVSPRRAWSTCSRTLRTSRASLSSSAARVNDADRPAAASARAFRRASARRP